MATQLTFGDEEEMAAFVHHRRVKPLTIVEQISVVMERHTITRCINIPAGILCTSFHST